ncbi:MAG TPA: type II toxin-antitoxin system Phd/YefM family antitoxin [Bacteroidota bacterium]|nr:type II toxin-antitoxin system Phd/YefM family antitoxin [Bacteroidota bacterium]
MTRLTASQLREDLSDALNKVAFGRERIVLRRSGKDMAALVPMEDYALLLEIEDKLDLEAMREALAEPGANSVWEEVKKDLGV